MPKRKYVPDPRREAAGKLLAPIFCKVYDEVKRLYPTPQEFKRAKEEINGPHSGDCGPLHDQINKLLWKKIKSKRLKEAFYVTFDCHPDRHGPEVVVGLGEYADKAKAREARARKKNAG